MVMPSLCTRCSRIPTRTLKGTVVKNARTCRAVSFRELNLCQSKAIPGASTWQHLHARLALLSEFQLGNLFRVPFIRAVGKPQRANIGPRGGEKSILRNARAPMRLNTSV